MRLPLFDCKHYRNRAQGFFEKPGNRAGLCKTDFFSEPEKPGLSYSDVVDALSQRQVYAINLLPVQAKCSCVFF
jgi:hypothetical protein